MKAEINDKNKQKFFAHYFGQKVLVQNDSIKPDELNVSWNWQHPSFSLLLKPLSSITDEDAIGLSEILFNGDKELLAKLGRFFIWAHFEDGERPDITPFWRNEIENTTQPWMLWCTDFLRSRGYALPFLGLSVEELISVGWVR